MGTLRIIAGELKGRRIRVPEAGQVRPTADRVREALFSILGACVAGARIMDAYSGSGALGFEALSRGARQLVFLEADRRTLATLCATASELGVEERCQFLRGSAEELLRGTAAPGPFDLILADPPYSAGQAERFLPLAAGRLDRAGRIVLERDETDEAAPAARCGLLRFRTAKYGRSCLDFYRHA